MPKKQSYNNIFRNFTKTLHGKYLYFHNVILYYIYLMNLSTIETVIVGSGVTLWLKPPNFAEKTSWEQCSFELVWAYLTCFSQMYTKIWNVFFRFLSKLFMRVADFNRNFRFWIKYGGVLIFFNPDKLKNTPDYQTKKLKSPKSALCYGCNLRKIDFFGIFLYLKLLL